MNLKRKKKLISVLFGAEEPPQPPSYLDGLFGWWKFDEGSGTTVLDYSGNDLNFVFGSSVPIWSGETLYFNSNYDYISILNALPTQFSGDFSVYIAWKQLLLPLPYTNKLYTLVGQSDPLFSYGWQLYTRAYAAPAPKESFRLRIGCGSSYVEHVISADPYVPLGRNRVGFVYFENQDDIQFYYTFNGEDTIHVASVPNTLGSPVAWAGSPLRVGYSFSSLPGELAYSFPGYVGTLMIWNRALSYNEMATVIPTFPPPA